MNLLPTFNTYRNNILKDRPSDEKVIAKYAGVLPYVLIELWKADGWGGYMKGMIWTVNPEEYEDIVKRWIDPPKGKPITVIMRSAFGDLFVWYEGWVRMIDVRHHTIIPIDEDLKSMFEYFFPARTYALEEMQAKYFTKAYEKLGPLKPDECYAFEPILALGGAENVENLKIVKLKEHLEILTQAYE